VDEAAKPIGRHAIVIEAALVTLKSQSREKRLRRIEVVAGKDGREPLLHGAAKLRPKP
jgi:hypothetical protein